MSQLTLSQFCKRSKRVTLLIDRALLLTDAAQHTDDIELGQLVLEKYSPVLTRLKLYESNLKTRVQVSMFQSSPITQLNSSQQPR